jgi:hypothetical protein
MSKCECTMSIQVLGDGCRYCQPQGVIERLTEERDILTEALECTINWAPDCQEVQAARDLLGID